MSGERGCFVASSGPFTDLDPVRWAHSNPQLFFRGGEVDAYQLLSWVLADVLVFGQGGCFVEQEGDWWLVASNRDWLRTKAHSVEQLFQRVVAEPRHGGHSMRAELLVAAYCRDIFTTTRAAEQAIKGSRPAASLVDSVFNDAWVERALFFRL